jgi:hypothetical protein
MGLHIGWTIPLLAAQLGNDDMFIVQTLEEPNEAAPSSGGLEEAAEPLVGLLPVSNGLAGLADNMDFDAALMKCAPFTSSSLDLRMRIMLRHLTVC